MTDATSETRSIAETWGRIFAWILARFLLIVLFLLPFILGCFVGGVGLHDPDTCWLLALGRYIYEHHSLPSTDPFSYTFALQVGKPFVMYQWLSELAFYLAFKIAGLSSLLIFCALMLGQSFLVFPLRLCSRNAPFVFSAVLTIIGVVASCFHYLARPEISSYFCMSICLLLLQKIYANDLKKFDWRLALWMSLLMLVWVNAHSAFTLGLVLQIATLAITFVQTKLEERRANGVTNEGVLGSVASRQGPLKTGAVALLGSSLATLCTPYGFGLWTYLPSLFFAKFNYRIDELRPIRAQDLHEFTYWPFIILCLVCLVVIARAIRFSKSFGISIRWSNIFVIVVAAYYGFSCRRIIPFAVLMMISQVGELWVRRTSIADIDERTRSIADSDTRTPSVANSDDRASSIADSDDRKFPIAYSFFANLEEQFARLMNPQSFVWPLTVTIACVIGSYFTFTKVVSPTIPQASAAFIPPVKAIEYLRKNRLPGNGFNDAQFGDMLIWYAPEIPVFIDTRYDMHGEGSVADYLTMMNGSDNWKQLFDRYQIKWVFLPPKAAVLEKLKSSANWEIVFENVSACVMKWRAH